MTNEEAIKKLQRHKTEYLDKYVDFSGITEALDMAIKVLSALSREHIEKILSGKLIYINIDYIKACEDIADNRIDTWVNEVPSAEETAEWISVSERLPKYNKTVLVSVKHKGKEAIVFTAQRRRRIKTPDIFECCTDDGWWDLRISAWDDHEVVAWMPLPEPYKPESEEK